MILSAATWRWRDVNVAVPNNSSRCAHSVGNIDYWILSLTIESVSIIINTPWWRHCQSHTSRVRLNVSSPLQPWPICDTGADRLTDKLRDKQPGRQTDWHTDRHTDGMQCIMLKTSIHRQTQYGSSVDLAEWRFGWVVTSSRVSVRWVTVCGYLSNHPYSRG